MKYGPERLLDELLSVGYTATLTRASDGNLYAVVPNFKILLGRFANQTIELGLLATPDFPNTVASAIHVKTQPPLLDYQDTIPGIRNIIQSPLGEDWRYWSKGFRWNGENTFRRLISQINEVFLNV
jgi:hypothetical protein